MAKFVFSMQNILNMKEKLEDQEKNNFAQANLRLQEAVAEQEELEQRLAEAKKKLQQEVSDALDVRTIRSREDAVEILRMYVRQQILVVKQREKEVDVAREHLNEAMKERKTFEKLREKALEAFLAEENLREQKEVDELVSYRYGVDSQE
ncbi:MAG: flagellar export protein FliJ [Eubacterium sp.]|nr:flagellar export protein FliJ [Eubacterium sp.]